MGYPLWKLMLAALFVLLAFLYAPYALAQHPPQHQAIHDQYYQTWMRPKGNFSGIGHRSVSCCSKADCFPVEETRKENGQYVVRPEGSNLWYKVPSAIIESNQPDPRESPDGRSHVCIIGGQAACFTEGGGT